MSLSTSQIGMETVSPSRSIGSIGSMVQVASGYSATEVGKSRSVPPRSARVDSEECGMGALGKHTDAINELARNTIRPQNCLVGSNNHESTMARNMAYLKLDSLGSLYAARAALRRYVAMAMETAGPPVQIVEAINEFTVPDMLESIVEMLPASQGIDMLV